MAEINEAYNTLAQNQQKEIEELKKENAELIEIRDMGCKVMEKAKETEKENAELTEFLKKTSTTMEKMDNIIKGQKKENEKLKEDNIAEFLSLLDKMAVMERENEELKKETEELKEENDLLKEENVEYEVKGSQIDMEGAAAWFQGLYEKYKKENEELKDKVMTWENISKKKTNALIPFFKKLDIDYSPAFDGGDYIEECLEKVSVKIAELKEAIQDKNALMLKWGEQEKISNVKTDLINELFSKIIKDADIDDGISISKEYGNKYIDEWNKMYEDIIKKTIEVMNHNEFDCDELYLKFHTCDNIVFRNPENDEEEPEPEPEEDKQFGFCYPCGEGECEETELYPVFTPNGKRKMYVCKMCQLVYNRVGS